MEDAKQPATFGGTVAFFAWRWAKWLSGGIASFVMLAMCASAFGAGQQTLPLGFISLWAISWCSILVHELGHALAAKVVGWRTVIFAVKPIRLNLITWRFDRARRADGGDIGGWVTGVPRHPATLTKQRYAWFVLGGPVANALLAVTAFWSASTWLPAHDRPDLAISTLAAATGFISAFFAIFNLFPSGRGGMSSDGALLRWIWRADAGWQRAITLVGLSALIEHGARPRDRPPWMLDELRALDSEDAVKAAAAMAISAALDSPPIDAFHVRGMIEEFRLRHGDSEWLSLCDAYLAAVWENDPAHARAVSWHGEQTADQLPLRLAVDAAIAAREGDRDAAHRLLRDMRLAARAESWMRPVFLDIDDQVRSLLDRSTSQPARPLPKSLTLPPIAP